jgi:SAM-dependent methyltransferase
MNDLVTPAAIHEREYLRQRLEPAVDDPLYLHLSDLRRGLETVLPSPGARILDYGCGGSPYRSLFRTEHYYRADIAGTADLDFVFGPDSRLSAPTAAYDCVLSTQVLEHVEHYQTYLNECRRVLQPKGLLILTTHGIFAEHGCPFDFWRWTADGLQVALQRGGFEVEQLLKLTTGPRALAFLNQQFHHRLVTKQTSVAAVMMRLSRLIYTRLRRGKLNTLCDAEYPHCRVVAGREPGHDLYIALLAVARPARRA